MPRATTSRSPSPPWRSTIGLKVMMAVSGVVLVGFAVGHMLGHLKMFEGRDAYNAYAEFLQGLGAIKWAVRLGLLAAVALHIYCGIALSLRNRRARPVRYEAQRLQRATPYGRAMLLTGVAFVAFLLYHLAHFTLGWVHPEYFDGRDALGRPDVYANFVLSFQEPAITVLYLVATVAVSMHVAHAASSMLRTLGLSSGRWRAACERLGPALGILLMVGFAIVPLACLLGWLEP
ncbi:MAG: succinate dehydrogenase cytochrome b subunit [Myxococcales bacterium]|nr:succinate dehydrogenase cytochrome b subunit [Myxococcales bacterium]